MSHRVYVLTIPDWRPTPLNRLLGHHMKAARLKRADRDMVAAYALKAGTPRATGKRRVDLVVRPAKGQRRTDGDSLFKSCLDSLKHAGLIVDDKPQWCEVGHYEPTLDGPARTEIILTDLT